MGDLVERLNAISAAMGSFGSIEREAAARIVELEGIGERLWLETREIRSEIPDEFLLVPPDGGDMKTHEGVANMRVRIEQLEAEVARLREALLNIERHNDHPGRFNMEIEKELQAVNAYLADRAALAGKAGT